MRVVIMYGMESIVDITRAHTTIMITKTTTRTQKPAVYKQSIRYTQIPHRFVPSSVAIFSFDTLLNYRERDAHTYRHRGQAANTWNMMMMTTKENDKANEKNLRRKREKRETTAAISKSKLDMIYKLNASNRTRYMTLCNSKLFIYNRKSDSKSLLSFSFVACNLNAMHVV